MATPNPSPIDPTRLPDARSMRIGIVVSEWNSDITENMLRGVRETLTDCGAALDSLRITYVPGSFELAMGAQMLLENKSLEAVICLGSIIRGETPHFEIVSQACAHAIAQVGLKYNRPVIFGVLTDNNLEQARARSGGEKGNKGIEAAVAAIKMVALRRELEDSWNF